MLPFRAKNRIVFMTLETNTATYRDRTTHSKRILIFKKAISIPIKYDGSFYSERKWHQTSVVVCDRVVTCGV